MLSLLHENLPALAKTVGYVGLFLMAFAESGVLVGLVLPGDSLLFVSGFLAASGYFNIAILLALFPIAGILGDSAGYWFGGKIGPRLFIREDGLLFKRSYVARTREFFERYGAKAVVLARFVPVVRTFAPILAGVGSMRYSLFLRFNIIGGLLWGWTMPLLGYFLGGILDARYILPLSLCIVALSIIPGAYELLRARKK